MNGKYIEALSDDEFLSRAASFLPGPGQEHALRTLAPHLKTRVKRLKEVCDQVEFLYLGRIELDREMLASQGAASPTALDALLAAEAALDAPTLDSFTEDAIEKALQD